MQSRALILEGFDKSMSGDKDVTEDYIFVPSNESNHLGFSMTHLDKSIDWKIVDHNHVAMTTRQ